MQTQKPAMYTQKKQLQAINILACLGWTHTSAHTHAHIDAHIHSEIDTPAARKQRDRMSPAAVDSYKRKDGGRDGRKDRAIGGGQYGGETFVFVCEKSFGSTHLNVNTKSTSLRGWYCSRNKVNLICLYLK